MTAPSTKLSLKITESTKATEDGPSNDPSQENDHPFDQTITENLRIHEGYLRRPFQ